MKLDLDDLFEKKGLSDIAKKPIFHRVLNDPDINKKVIEIKKLSQDIEKKEKKLKDIEEHWQRDYGYTRIICFFLGFISFFGALIAGGIFMEYRSIIEGNAEYGYNMDYYPHVTAAMIISCLIFVIVIIIMRNIAIKTGSVNSPKIKTDIESAKKEIDSVFAIMISMVPETEAKVLGMVYQSRCWNTYCSLNYGVELTGAERIMALGLGQSTNTRVPSEELQDSQGHRYDDPFIDNIGRKWKSVWHKIEVLSLKVGLKALDKNELKYDNTNGDNNTVIINGIFYGDDYENRGFQEHQKLVEQYGPEYIELGEWSCKRAYNDYVEAGHDIDDAHAPDFNDWKLKYDNIEFSFYKQERNKKKAKKDVLISRSRRENKVRKINTNNISASYIGSKEDAEEHLAMVAEAFGHNHHIPKKETKKEILTVECPKCSSKIKVQKISNTQPIKCSNCGLEGEIEL